MENYKAAYYEALETMINNSSQKDLLISFMIKFYDSSVEQQDRFFTVVKESNQDERGVQFNEQMLSLNILYQQNLTKFADFVGKGSQNVGSKRSHEFDSEKSQNEKDESDKVYLVKQKK